MLWWVLAGHHLNPICVHYFSNRKQFRTNVPGQHSIQAMRIWNNLHYFHNKHYPRLFWKCGLSSWAFSSNLPSLMPCFFCLLISITCQLRWPHSTPHARWLRIFFFLYYHLKHWNKELHNKTTDLSPGSVGQHLERVLSHVTVTLIFHNLDACI